MSLPATQTQVLFVSRPNGVPDPETTFRVTTSPLNAELKDGEVLCKNIYLSLDPTMRGWMVDDRRSYMAPLEINEVMRGGTAAVVVRSRHPNFAPGDVVSGFGGWQEYSVERGRSLAKIDVGEGSLVDAVSILGGTGLTAMCGIFAIGLARKGALPPGSTVVVSGAAGATGSVACQIYKHVLKCRVIGIAGTDEKCSWLRNDVGIDVCLNYKSKTFAKDLAAVVGPKGILEVFENVGGEILELCLDLIARDGSIVLCGGISNYNDFANARGPRNYMRLVVQQASMSGFVVIYHAARFPEWRRQLVAWMKEGKVRNATTVVKGLENAPKALNYLWTGGNTGKLLVQVAEEGIGGAKL